MNYQNHYDLLISKSKSRILEGYSERHHIIPVCMSGDNSKENLVKLTPEEHYLAHQLLVKIYPGNHKLVFAANMMANTRPGNKQYGWLRRKHSIVISETRTGRTKETHEYLKHMSEKKTGRTKENHPGVQAQSEKLTGRTKENDPRVKAMSEKKRKLTDEQEQILFNMRNSTISGKEIVEYFRKLNIHIVNSSVYAIYNRAKLENLNVI